MDWVAGDWHVSGKAWDWRIRVCVQRRGHWMGGMHMLDGLGLIAWIGQLGIGTVGLCFGAWALDEWRVFSVAIEVDCSWLWGGVIIMYLAAWVAQWRRFGDIGWVGQQIGFSSTE